jgi:hypothetical protein
MLRNHLSRELEDGKLTNGGRSLEQRPHREVPEGKLGEPPRSEKNRRSVDHRARGVEDDVLDVSTARTKSARAALAVAELHVDRPSVLLGSGHRESCRDQRLSNAALSRHEDGGSECDVRSL